MDAAAGEVEAREFGDRAGAGETVFPVGERAAVEGAFGRGEFLRPGGRVGLDRGVDFEAEAAGGALGEHGGAGFGAGLGSVGGGVDEGEEIRAAGGGADIDGGVGGEAARAELREFGLVVWGEEDVVVGEGEGFGGAGEGPGDRRKGRFGAAGEAGDGALGGLAEQAGIDGGEIGIGDDGVRGVAGLRRGDGGDAGVGGFDVGDALVEAEFGAGGFGEGLKDFREADHAAFDAPDAEGLGMGDQGEGCGRLERGGAAIGGVAGEELAEARIGEVFGEFVPEGGEGGDFAQARAGAGDQAKEAGLRDLHEGGVKKLEDFLGAGGEGGVAGGGAGAGELGDRFDVVGGVREKVQAGAVGPGMAGQDVKFFECEVGFEGGAGGGEDAVEDRAHGEDGGAGIDVAPVDVVLVEFAAGLRGGFEDRDVLAGMGEQEGGDEAGHTRADDGDSHEGSIESA